MMVVRASRTSTPGQDRTGQDGTDAKLVAKVRPESERWQTDCQRIEFLGSFQVPTSTASAAASL